MQKNVFVSPLFPFFLSLITLINFSYGQNPSSISGLKLWLKTDTGVVLNGLNVTGWNDQSGNSNNATQNDNLSQPMLVANALNNLPAIRFNGNKILNGNEIPLLSSSPLTIFIVASGGSMTDAYNVLFDIGPYAPGGIWLSKNSDKFTIYSNNVIYTSSAGILPNAGFSPIIFEYKKQFNIIAESFINLSTVASSSNPSFTSSFSNGAYNIGGDPTYTGLWNGDIFEIILFNKSLDSSENKIVNNYLIKKYAPVLNLGADITVSPAAGCIPSSPITIQANPNFNSYLWNTGNTSNKITVNQYSSYSVICTDIFGIQHFDTIKVIQPVKNFNYPVTNKLCEKETIQWNTNLNKAENSFKWQDNSTDSLIDITQGGKYYVTITDTYGCVYNSDTVTITVDNISSSISLGADTTFCSGNSIYLKKGASQAVSYLWSTNSATDSLVIKTSGKYWLTVKSINNCSATDTINVIISGSAPTANFSNTPGVCIGKSMQFNDLSTAAAGNTIVSWAWDFGDSQIATQQNPIHIYSDTGSFKVKLNIITDGGCSNQFSKIVKVYPYPQIAIFASNACEQSKVQFSNTLLTFGYPITKWSWTFGDPSSGSSNFSTLQNPAHLYVAQGNYQSQLIIQNSFGCADTAITSVTIKPKPTADFNYSFACKNDSIQFTNSSLLPTATSLQKTYWNFGDNSTSLLGNPKHKYISAVTYHASFIVTASNGCSDTARKTITVNDNPIAYFSTSNACVNSPVNFDDFSVISNGTIANWLWEIDSMMLSNVKNPSYTFTKVGNANVQLEVTSDKGCKNKTNKTIVINPTPTASFSLNPSYGNPPFAVNFTNTSNGALSYVWNFGDGNTSILQNPTNTYKDTGSFKVTLTIKNNLGCLNEVNKTVNSLKKIIDVKVQDISAVIKNDFLNITVQLVNKGTADITKLDLYIKVNDGPEVKEEWSGLLLRGGAIIHTFKASVSLKDDNHYVCVTAANPNGLDDEDPSNNKLCKGINVNTFQVFELYPNPVNEAISVTLPLVIPKKELLTITIYDCNGKFVKTAFSEVLTEGLQLVNISVIGLKSGLYACKIEYRKESAIKKMMLY